AHLAEGGDSRMPLRWIAPGEYADPRLLRLARLERGPAHGLREVHSQNDAAIATRPGRVLQQHRGRLEIDGRVLPHRVVPSRATHLPDLLNEPLRSAPRSHPTGHQRRRACRWPGQHNWTSRMDG